MNQLMKTKTSSFEKRSRPAATGKWLALLLAATAIQTIGTQRLQAAVAEKMITDKGITVAVEDGFKSEKGVFPNSLTVSTSQGIVTLTGSEGIKVARLL